MLYMVLKDTNWMKVGCIYNLVSQHFWIWGSSILYIYGKIWPCTFHIHVFEVDVVQTSITLISKSAYFISLTVLHSGHLKKKLVFSLAVWKYPVHKFAVWQMWKMGTAVAFNRSLGTTRWHRWIYTRECTFIKVTEIQKTKEHTHTAPVQIIQVHRYVGLEVAFLLTGTLEKSNKSDVMTWMSLTCFSGSQEES